MLNQRGQSLVQILIGVAIMGIMMIAFATMTANQSREASALAQKLAAMDFQQQLTRTFSDGTLCTSLLTLPTARTFDSTNALLGSPNPPIITLTNTYIPVSTAPSAPS